MSSIPEAIFDCNIFLQAMLSSRGAAHACWRKAVDGEIKLHISNHVLGEIRRLPQHRSLHKYRSFTAERIERFLEELLELAILDSTPPALFEYSRDPADAHYINLAIVTGASRIVSYDKDLLDLMNIGNPDGIRLLVFHPSLRVVTPPLLLAELNRNC